MAVRLLFTAACGFAAAALAAHYALPLEFLPVRQIHKTFQKLDR